MDKFEMFTLFLSILAICFSGYTLWQNRTHHRQSIRINKIERMLFIIEELRYCYSAFIQLTHPLSFYYSENEKFVEKKSKYLEEHAAECNKLSDVLDIDNLVNQRRELEMLARVYLPETIQYRILSYSNLFRDLISYTIQMQNIVIRINWKEGFPEIGKINNYAEELSSILFNEINFEKGINNFDEKLKEYRESRFKKDVGLINSVRD